MSRSVLTLVLSLALVLQACGSGDGGANSAEDDQARSSAPSDPPRQLFDPPRGFDSSGAVNLGEHGYNFAMLDASTAILASDSDLDPEITSIRTVNLQGAVKSEFEVAGELIFGTSIRSVRMQGRPVVIVAVNRTVKGSGTRRDRVDNVVGAYDATTGEQLWESVIGHSGAELRIVDSSDRSVIIGNLFQDNTVALNVADGKELWRADVTALVVDGGIVVGRRRGEEGNAVGLNSSDGSVVWKGPELVYPKGLLTFNRNKVVSPGTVAVQAYSGTRFIDSKSGEVVATRDDELDCRSDMAAYFVCGNEETLVGFSAKSMKSVWEISGSDPEREVPIALAARKNVVYAQSSNGLMTLDARTGKDLDVDLGIDDIYMEKEEVLDVVPGFLIARRVPDDASSRSPSTVVAYPAVR